MKAGIVGLPNVGNQHYLIVCQMQSAKRQFSFCTIEPNIGVVNVPDSRIEKLEELVKPERTNGNC
jgi:ribosome-binding ATPase YchF (GTP1/OBG family)